MAVDGQSKRDRRSRSHTCEQGLTSAQRGQRHGGERGYRSSLFRGLCRGSSRVLRRPDFAAVPIASIRRPRTCQQCVLICQKPLRLHINSFRVQGGSFATTNTFDFLSQNPPCSKIFLYQEDEIPISRHIYRKPLACAFAKKKTSPLRRPGRPPSFPVLVSFATFPHPPHPAARVDS
jgi:hypothetical protein